MAVLVAAASRHGATDEIAERIGADLAECGLSVEVKKVRDVASVDSYDAVVLGSAVYFGNWMKDARQFLDTHADELSQRTTWLFASGPITGNPPVTDDNNGLSARLAEQLVEKAHAREHKTFGGKLDINALHRIEKAVAKGVHASEGDHRDWKAVDEWAAGIAKALLHRRGDIGRPMSPP
jgi:menaquinone-dependent protoporphyrinogen oxidase